MKTLNYKNIKPNSKHGFLNPKPYTLPAGRQALYPSKGFTLIEMIVAVGVFSVVMVVSVGSLVSIIDANRKAQSVKSVANNLNFALDSMSRAIRLGSDYECVGIQLGKCAEGGTQEFSFEAVKGDPNTDDDQFVYVLKDNQILRSKNNGISFSPITAPEVKIDELRFYVDGITTGDTKQPRVLIITKGQFGTKAKTSVDFSLQTLVSQRRLDR